MSNVADFARSEQSFDQWSSGHQDVDAVRAPDEAKDHRADGQRRAEADLVKMSLLSIAEGTIGKLKIDSKKPLKPQAVVIST